MSDSQQSSNEILTKTTITAEKILSAIKTYNPGMKLLEKPIQADNSISVSIGKSKWVISSEVYYHLHFSLETIERQAKCVGLIVMQHMPPAKINGCDQIQKDIKQIVHDDGLPGVQFKDVYEQSALGSATLKPA